MEHYIYTTLTILSIYFAVFGGASIRVFVRRGCGFLSITFISKLYRCNWEELKVHLPIWVCVGFILNNLTGFYDLIQLEGCYYSIITLLILGSYTLLFIGIIYNKSNPETLDRIVNKIINYINFLCKHPLYILGFLFFILLVTISFRSIIMHTLLESGIGWLSAFILTIFAALAPIRYVISIYVQLCYKYVLKIQTDDIKWSLDYCVIEKLNATNIYLIFFSIVVVSFTPIGEYLITFRIKLCEGFFEKTQKTLGYLEKKFLDLNGNKVKVVGTPRGKVVVQSGVSFALGLAAATQIDISPLEWEHTNPIYKTLADLYTFEKILKYLDIEVNAGDRDDLGPCRVYETDNNREFKGGVLKIKPESEGFRTPLHYDILSRYKITRNEFDIIYNSKAYYKIIQDLNPLNNQKIKEKFKLNISEGKYTINQVSDLIGTILDKYLPINKGYLYEKDYGKDIKSIIGKLPVKTTYAVFTSTLEDKKPLFLIFTQSGVGCSSQKLYGNIFGKLSELIDNAQAVDKLEDSFFVCIAVKERFTFFLYQKDFHATYFPNSALRSATGRNFLNLIHRNDAIEVAPCVDVKELSMCSYDVSNMDEGDENKYDLSEVEGFGLILKFIASYQKAPKVQPCQVESQGSAFEFTGGIKKSEFENIDPTNSYSLEDNQVKCNMDPRNLEPLNWRDIVRASNTPYIGSSSTGHNNDLVAASASNTPNVGSSSTGESSTTNTIGLGLHKNILSKRAISMISGDNEVVSSAFNTPNIERSPTPAGESSTNPQTYNTNKRMKK